MRVSCVGFARLQGDDLRYCLLINRRNLTQGRRILSPIGGGLKVRPEGKKFLRQLGATAFEEVDGLRFRLPDVQVPRVAAWFNQRKDRELTARRELYEELVDEYRLVYGTDLERAREYYAGFFRFTSTPPPSEVPKPQTTYLGEVYSIEVGEAALSRLRSASRHPDPLVYFVTRREIEQGFAADDTRISPMTRHILPRQ